MQNAMKPRVKLRYNSDEDYKRKRQLLSPDLDQLQIKLALCWAAPYRSDVKSPTEIVHKLRGNGHWHTLLVAAKWGFIPVTYTKMAHRDKIWGLSKINLMAWSFTVASGKIKSVGIHMLLH